AGVLRGVQDRSHGRGEARPSGHGCEAEGDEGMSALQTRKPSGLPSWPILLLAGREKAGKSWAAVSASASPLVGRTLYIGIGEDDPDEYSIIPGADFEIVVHDGTFPGILAAVRAAVG